MRYYNIKTGKPYTLLADNFMVKIDGNWKNGFVLYKADNYNPECQYFSMTKDEFYENFKSEMDCPFEMLPQEKTRRSEHVIPIVDVIEAMESGTFDDCDGEIYYATNKVITFIEADYESMKNGNHRPEFSHVYVSGK